jgi:hypothetical protein
MKIALAILASSLVSSFAFANEPAMTTTPTTTEAAAATAAAPEMKKMTKKEAKMACKSEGKKGKELKNCMKSKMM